MDLHQMKVAFARHFSTDEPPLAVRAPGRVNLIGEHTDYNDGFVLPMAIDASIVLVGALRSDRQVHLYSLDFQAADRFELSNITSSTQNPWSNYIRGVCALLQETTPLQGMNIMLQGDVPEGAGLSSSAALEVGTVLLVKLLQELVLEPIAMVKIAQRAENEFVGVQCGIMDQFISMLAKRDHVLFLDCRSLEYETVLAPFGEARVVVIDSGVKRGLVDSEYNTRRRQCNEAVERLKQELPSISALRDVLVSQLPLVNQLPDILAKRSRHVVTENDRVLQAVDALRSGDLVRFGRLMDQSHASLRDDYQVSCGELDLLVTLAHGHPGLYGSRMMGGGFGGCTVSLVDRKHVGAFRHHVGCAYEKETGIRPRIFEFSASEGAHALD